MTLNELRGALRSGAVFSKIFPYKRDGQECEIFKTSWPENVKENLDEVIYLPDLSLNDLDRTVDKPDLTEDEIVWLIGNCYTVSNFISIAEGNVRLAKDLFEGADWQHPDIIDLESCTDDAEAVRDYGETFQQMHDRADGIKKTREELYRLYQLDWMAESGLSVEDVIDKCQQIVDDYIEDRDKAEGSSLDLQAEIDETGFDRGMYASFREFLKNEYQGAKYMERLAQSSGTGLDLLYWYEIDTNPDSNDDGVDLISIF